MRGMDLQQRNELAMTAYLTIAFKTDGLSQGIIWVLARRASGLLAQQALERSVERFSEGVVAQEYGAVYRKIVSLAQST
jgi:glycosyltransferase involved in cell wall biosynthesis